jgi:hypothetical protein
MLLNIISPNSLAKLMHFETKEEFPLEQLEHAANPQEEPVQKMLAEPAIDGPLP